MAKNGYVSVDGKARKIGKYFVGDENGVARKVTKAYIGDENGKARLCYVAHVHDYSIYTYAQGTALRHNVTKTCSCGAFITTDELHSYESYGSWISVGADGCYKKKKCICGRKVDGSPSAHAWPTTGEVLTKATCSSMGTQKLIAICCGYSKTESIPINPNNHGNYTSKITVQATCTQTGVRTYTCGCGKHSYTETIKRTDHRYGPDGKCMYCGFGSVLG